MNTDFPSFAARLADEAGLNVYDYAALVPVGARAQAGGCATGTAIP